MTVDYNKLWHLLVDKKMNKSALVREAKLNWSTVSKLTKNEHVSTHVLAKICSTLECEVSDIMELIKEDADFDFNSDSIVNKKRSNRSSK